MKYILPCGVRQIAHFILSKHLINSPRPTFIKTPFPQPYLISHLLSIKKVINFDLFLGASPYSIKFKGNP